MAREEERKKEEKEEKEEEKEKKRVKGHRRDSSEKPAANLLKEGSKETEVRAGTFSRRWHRNRYRESLVGS